MSQGDDLESLDGVGPATAEKFVDAGYETFQSIAVASPGELEQQANIGEGTAEKAIASAREKADVGGFETGAEIHERRQEINRIQWRVPEVDELIGGGVESQSITEIYGEFGSGKSQITHQLAVNVQLPPEHGGVGKSAIFIDSEDTFRPNRVADMVRGLPDDVLEDVRVQRDIDGSIDEEDTMDAIITDILDKIHVAKAFNTNHQMLIAEQALETASELDDTDWPVGLVVVDSLTTHFRAEFVGRGELADRQQKLNRHLHDIDRIANLHNAAAVVTNQVQSNPDAFFGDPTKPIGGHILGHKSNVRIYLKKSKGSKRIVKLVDAPDLPDGEAVMRIEEDGLIEE